MTIFRITALTACLLLPSLALAQALPNISSLSVRYNTRKATVKPEGELKIQIDAVDKEIAAANRAGKAGEVRRQIAKGMSLLDGTPWTPALDFQNSLALRSERTVVDSSAVYALRLEQIYSPAIELTPAITAKVALRKRTPPVAGSTAPPATTTVKELGAFDGLSRDLRESPFAMELDVSGVPDGAYVIETQVLDGATLVATTSLGVVLHKGLDARLRALEAAAASVIPSVRADVTYPSDYIRNVNRGRIGLQTFNVGTELAAAEAVLAAAKGGKDPFKGRTGDFERHYLLEGAERSDAVSRVRAEGLLAGQRHAARDCPARTGRQRRLVLRSVLEADAPAGREARLPVGGTERLPRRRLLRLQRDGRRRCRGPAPRRGQRERRARSAATDEGQLQRGRIAHLPDRALDGRDRHLGAWCEVRRHLGRARAVLGPRARPPSPNA